jgi:hypothetical protein
MAEQRRTGAYAKLLANYASDDAVIEAGEKAELLFTRALAFLANADSDGYITDAQLVRYVGAGMSDAVRRARRLVEVGLWTRMDGGYYVRSWLKYHESAEAKGRKRRTDRERKRAHSPTGFLTDSARNPDGRPPESEQSPDGFREQVASESLLCSYVSTEGDTQQDTTETQQDRALRRGRNPRGTRLPDDWIPDGQVIEWQRREGIPDDLARHELPRFRDYWHAQPGAKGTKADWSATWRNWLRRAHDEHPTAVANGNTNHGKATTKAQGWLALGRQLSEGHPT